MEPEKTNAKESNADVDFCANAAINEQRRNMVGEVAVGRSLGNGQHQSTGNSDPQGAVAVITGFDEYGPFLGWHTHWVNLPVGARLYTTPQAQPAVEPVSNDLRDRLVAISAAIAEQDDRAAQQMIRELLAAPQAQQPRIGSGMTVEQTLEKVAAQQPAPPTHLSLGALDEIYRESFGLIDSRLVGDQIKFARAIETTVRKQFGVNDE